MSAVLEQETSEPQAPGTTTAALPPKPSRRRILLPIVGVLVAAGLVWGVRQWSYARAHESTDNAQVDGHIIPVLAKVGGYVTAVGVSENQPVRSGQLLVQIDEAEY